MTKIQQIEELINQWANEYPEHRSALVILQETSPFDEEHEKTENHVTLRGHMNKLRPVFRSFLTRQDDEDIKPLQANLLRAFTEAAADNMGLIRDNDDVVESTTTKKKNSPRNGWPFPLRSDGEA